MAVKAQISSSEDAAQISKTSFAMAGVVLNNFCGKAGFQRDQHGPPHRQRDAAEKELKRGRGSKDINVASHSPGRCRREGSKIGRGSADINMASHGQDFCRKAGAGLRVFHFSKKFKLDVEVRGCPKFCSRFVQDNAVQAA